MNFHTYRKKDKDEDYQEVKVINLDSKSSNIYYTASVVNNLTYNPPDPVRSIPKEKRKKHTKKELWQVYITLKSQQLIRV